MAKTKKEKKEKREVFVAINENGNLDVYTFTNLDKAIDCYDKLKRQASEECGIDEFSNEDSLYFSTKSGDTSVVIGYVKKEGEHK